MKPFALDQALPRGVALLEASAGTGKTFSIAGLSLRLIAELGIPVGELLIVTFTRAATAELAERIHKRLLAGARALRGQLEEPVEPADIKDPVLRALIRDASESTLRERLRRLEVAIASFDEAAISTIHGFCQRALQSAAFESATDFEVEMEADLRPLVQECVDDFMATAFVDAPAAYYAVLRKVAKLDRDAFLKLARELEADPGAEVLPRNPPRPLQVHADALDAFLQAWAAEGPDYVASLSAAVKAKTLKLSGKEYGPGPIKKLGPRIEAWVEAHKASAPLPSDGLMALRTLSGRQMASKLKEGEFPEGELPQLLDQLLYAPATALRAEFAQTFRASFADKKRERGVLAFDDLLRRLQRALLDPERSAVLREVIQKDYRAALIDESQDTDAVQWSIFSQLFGSNERPLYLIGDPKQAIYSFRGADVATYLEARAEAGEQRFGLDTNWRSDAPLVETLNGLYGAAPRLAEGIEVPAVKAAPGHEASALHGGQHSAPLVVRHFPADFAGSSKKQPYSSSFKAATKLASMAGRELGRLLNDGVKLRDEDGQLRDLHAGDIAVIVDTHHQAAAVEAALQAQGLPCVRTGHGSVFESEAAAALGIWLDAVANARARGSARALLVGPLIGLSPRELDELDELELEDWDEAFAHWRERWYKLGFLAAWKSCEDRLDLHAKTLAQAGGARFWTDLRQLVGLLHEAETSARLAPAALIRWFARWPEDARQVEDEHALRLDRDDDAITITTLHASKGLEYGIVLCPTAWDGPRKVKGTNLRVRVPDRDPPWVLDLRDEGLDPDKAANIEHAELAASEEQARKLYVALTRAKHQLIVYWGAFEGSESSALARLLFPELDPPALRALEDEDRLEALGRLQARLADGVEVLDHHELEASIPALEASGLDPHSLSRRHFSRSTIDRDWRRASYSSLSRAAQFQALAHTDQVDDASPEAAGIDHDQFVDPDQGASVTTTSDDGAQVPLAAFERGAAAGTYLHEILELVDFEQIDDRNAFIELCEDGIERHRLTKGTGALVARGLHAAAHTPLGGPLGDWSLAQLTRGDRVDEMQFDLPLAGGYAGGTDHAVARDGIAKLFAEHRQPCSAMPQRAIAHYASMQLASPLRGFLTGAIDLFFRAPDADGRPRYFVADYKSNWLGAADRKRSTLAHYHPDALVEAMLHHDYHLQYHLYVLAAHRFLRSRLGTNYDYERDFGGAYYLFLRGMGGADSPRFGEDQSPSGVFFDKPPAAFVEAMDALFSQGGAS